MNDQTVLVILIAAAAVVILITLPAAAWIMRDKPGKERENGK